MEDRRLLAGDSYLINFQLAGTSVPNRYIADTGEIFADRGGGLSFGWSSDHTDVSRDRDAHPDQRLDTLIHFHENQTWELALPNGLYEVHVAIGDAEHPSTHTLNVEGTSVWDAVSLSPGEFLTETRTVTVADGRLTLDQGDAGEKATRIDYIQIFGLPSAANTPPSQPIILEPLAEGLFVNPTDVHLEAVGFSDSDGDTHRSSDWEIWTTGADPTRVWATLGIEGVERLHTHLADGVFENSHAGQTELNGQSSYELRVRFRDSAGSVSDDSTRTFNTTASSTVAALQLKDIAATPPPVWKTASGFPIDLPASTPNVSSLTVGSAANDLLYLAVAQQDPGNQTIDGAPLAAHASVRLVVQAGSDGLQLAESDFVLIDELGREQTIFLPAVSLAADERLDLWVAFGGATYFGAAAQTEPDFSNPARGAAIEVPFVAVEPGFVVEQVAADFQLPVNIAFVPEPGPNPDDPLFYVTELYGTVKVVSNDGSVGDYASGLLNFNPTGNFPGSGEQGLTGVVVEPETGDVIVTRVTSSIPFDDGAPHHPQVVRFSSGDGGRTANSETVILNMPGESQGQSHQISNASIGPDGLLYIHNGDGFDAGTAQDLDSYRGKVLRLNLDGSAPDDNPFYDAADGINSRDYVYAYGFRNPFGGAWRASDGRHYEVENGPSVDRFARVEEGVNYGWNGSNSSMRINSIYNWSPAHAPVNITFVQPETFAGSQFPTSMMDLAFVSESGPTYASGPQSRGKRIVSFELDASGDVVGGPNTLLEYVGEGRATIVGLAAGPDGLYFTDLYKDLDAMSPIDRGARVLRVRFEAGDVSFTASETAGAAPFSVDFTDTSTLVGGSAWSWDFGDGQTSDVQHPTHVYEVPGIYDVSLTVTGSTGQVTLVREALITAAAGGDFNLDGRVDGDDFLIWQANFPTSAGATLATGDADADGDTDGDDFLVWQSNFGSVLDGNGGSRTGHLAGIGWGAVLTVNRDFERSTDRVPSRPMQTEANLDVESTAESIRPPSRAPSGAARVTKIRDEVLRGWPEPESKSGRRFKATVENLAVGVASDGLAAR